MKDTPSSSTDTHHSRAAALDPLLAQTLNLLGEGPQRRIVAAVAGHPEARIEPLAFERGTSLRIDGSQGCVGIVTRGHLVRRVDGPRGRSQIVDWFKAGSLLGLAASMADAPAGRFTGVSAGSVLLIANPRMRDIVAGHTTLHQQVHRLVFQELAMTQRRLVTMALGSSTERLAAFMLALAEDGSPAPASEVDFPFTQQDLAEVLGLSLAQIQRALSRLREAGVAHVSRGGLHILSIQDLRLCAFG